MTVDFFRICIIIQDEGDVCDEQKVCVCPKDDFSDMDGLVILHTVIRMRQGKEAFIKSA